jgi:hypothetical protein
MKPLIGLLVLLLVGFGLVMWYFNAGAGGGPRWSLPMAVAAADGGQLEFNAGVLRDMLLVEARTLIAARSDSWVADHLELREEGGEPIPLEMVNRSNIIPAERAGHPEFYVQAFLSPEQTYVIDFIPVKGSPLRLRGMFTVHSDGLPFERLILESVVEE